jgi:hypothetical protein
MIRRGTRFPSLASEGERKLAGENPLLCSQGDDLDRRRLESATAAEVFVPFLLRTPADAVDQKVRTKDIEALFVSGRTRANPSSVTGLDSRRLPNEARATRLAFTIKRRR